MNEPYQHHYTNSNNTTEDMLRAVIVWLWSYHWNHNSEHFPDVRKLIEHVSDHLESLGYEAEDYKNPPH